MSNEQSASAPHELRVITTDLAGCYHVVAEWNTSHAILKLAPPVITTYYNDRPNIWYQVRHGKDGAAADADTSYEWDTIEYTNLIELLANIKTKQLQKT